MSKKYDVRSEILYVVCFFVFLFFFLFVFFFFFFFVVVFFSLIFLSRKSVKFNIFLDIPLETRTQDHVHT